MERKSVEATGYANSPRDLFDLEVDGPGDAEFLKSSLSI
jgi:hypothetical protein